MPDLINKEVTFTLTDAQLLDKAREAARLHKDILEKEDELKDYSKSARQEIANLESDLAHHWRDIRTGQEIRMVKCEMKKDHDRGIVQFLYGEKLVEERAMTVEERQLELTAFQNNSAT